MELLEFFQTEWATISQTPFTFITAGVLVAALAWALGRFQSNEKISNLESRLELRDDKITQYESKLQGATPDEAAAKIESLEKRLSALEPVTISEDQIQVFADIVRPYRNKITIVTDASSPERKVLAGQLADAFTKGGWIVNQGAALGPNYRGKTGIGFTAGVGGSLHSGSEQVKEALQRAGLKYDLLPNHPEGAPHSDMQLLLTTAQR